VPDPDADRAILVMHAQGDHRAFEARIGHPWHCQEQLTGQEVRLIDHGSTMVRSAPRDKS
jgi:hypothetical protein